MPVSEDFKPYTTSTYAVLHAIDTERQKQGRKLGDIVAITIKEIAADADLTDVHTYDLAMALEEMGVIERVRGKGIIQYKPLPLKAVKQ